MNISEYAEAFEIELNNRLLSGPAPLDAFEYCTQENYLTCIIPVSLEKGMDIIKNGGCVYTGKTGEKLVLPKQKVISKHWRGIIVKAQLVERIMLLPISKPAAYQHRSWFIKKWTTKSTENEHVIPMWMADKLYRCSLPDKHQLVNEVIIALNDKCFVKAANSFAKSYDFAEIKDWQNRWFDQTNDLIKEFGLSKGKLVNLLKIVDYCSTV